MNLALALNIFSVKEGPGSAEKTSFFGLLKRDGNVYAQVVKICSKDQLMPIIRGENHEGSTVHTDKLVGGLWGTYFQWI